ncbi:MAG: hypothetical protein ACXVCV_14785, partial [Polyangia bacterium]
TYNGGGGRVGVGIVGAGTTPVYHHGGSVFGRGFNGSLGRGGSGGGFHPSYGGGRSGSIGRAGSSGFSGG